MISELVKGIGNSLYKKFGDDIKIFYGEVSQGFNGECFLIALNGQSKRNFIGKRYFLDSGFNIFYYKNHNPLEDAKVDLNDIALGLFEVLEFIVFEDGFLRGKKTKYEIKEGVLKFFVEYGIFVTNDDGNFGNDEGSELMGGVDIYFEEEK